MIPKFYHGGARNLQPGDTILPPSVTGKATLFNIAEGIAPDGPQRRDRVYLTTDPAAAMFFASVYPYGWVYRVTPIGDLEPDPDCVEPGLSWQCESARIDAVVRMNIPPELAQAVLGGAS